MVTSGNNQGTSGVYATFGAVACSNWIAAQVGMRMLELGGNAIDAATAAGFALQVVEPYESSIGGEVVLAIKMKDREPRILCGQGVAPAKATISHYQSLGLSRIPERGVLASVVPGALDGWLTMFRDYGKLSLEDVLMPALEYAVKGFPAYPELVTELRLLKSWMTQWKWTGSTDIYLPGGRAPEIGSPVVNSALGATFSRLLSAGRSAGADRYKQLEAARNEFYRGSIARDIDKFIKNTVFNDVLPQAYSGILSSADLANWSATYETPISYNYRGWTLYKPGPWSQAPAFLQMLALFAHLPMEHMHHTSAEFVHTVVEAAKLAYEDRERWYGDPRFVDVPMDMLLSEDYNAARAKLITERALGGIRQSGSSHPSSVATQSTDEASDSAILRKSGDTAHIVVADCWGNVVSAAPSGGWIGGSPTIPALGFQLNTRAQMFWLDPESPSSLSPGKRPRTTLSPTIAVCPDGRVLAFGGQGADRHDQWGIQLFLRYMDSKLTLQEIVDGGSFYSEHWNSSTGDREARPNRLVLNPSFSEGVKAELSRRGHDVVTPKRQYAPMFVALESGREFIRACAAAAAPRGRALGR